jgi:hypothetical protein
MRGQRYFQPFPAELPGSSAGGGSGGGTITLPAGDLSGDGSSNADPTISNLTGHTGLVTVNPAATIQQTESAPGAGLVPFRYVLADAGNSPWSMRIDGSDVVREGFNVAGIDDNAQNQLWQGFVQNLQGPPGTFNAVYHLQFESPFGAFPTEIIGASYQYAGPGSPSWGIGFDIHGSGTVAMSDDGVTFVEFVATGETIIGATPWTVAATGTSYTVIAGPGGITLATTGVNPITLGAGTIGLWAGAGGVTLNTRGGSQFGQITTDAGLDRIIFGVGTGIVAEALELGVPQGTASAQSTKGEQVFAFYGNTAGAVAGNFPLGYTPPSGHSSRVVLDWNAHDVTTNASYSKRLEATLTNIAGTATLQGTGTVNSAGDGSAALATATAALTVIAGVPNITFTPPAAYPDNLLWKGTVSITEN